MESDPVHLLVLVWYLFSVLVRRAKLRKRAEMHREHWQMRRRAEVLREHHLRGAPIETGHPLA